VFAVAPHQIERADTRQARRPDRVTTIATPMPLRTQVVRYDPPVWDGVDEFVRSTST
jgi:hypothetical protein